MATLIEVRAKVEALNVALADATTRITGDVDHLRSIIAGLGADQVAIDEIDALLTSITSTVSAIDPVTDFPEVPTAP